MKYEIKNRFTGAAQFTADIECDEGASTSIKIGLAVRWAIKACANLTGANLAGAYLAWADLAGADLAGADLARANLARADLSLTNLVDGGQRSDGYRFVGWIKEGVLQIRAGCRNFTIDEARNHWTAARAGAPLGDETMVILDHIERVAKIRGLVAP